MNENINLVEILKYCPGGTELYSTTHGKVFFWSIEERTNYPIKVYMPKEGSYSFTKEGKAFNLHDAECVLFPSKDQRDWSKFKVYKFNLENFKPFCKVLVKDWNHPWRASLFSHITKDGRIVTAEGLAFLTHVIPYDEGTCDLIGTNKDCPDFYKWWEK